MVCIDQCSLEAPAAGNVFDDAEHSRLVRPIGDANAAAYNPHPTLLAVEAADGDLEARVRTARHVRYGSQDHCERDRIVEVLAAQTIECLERTSVHALKARTDPGHLHPPPAQDALVHETRHEIGDDPVAEFTFNQANLGFLPGADILNLRHEVQWVTVAVAYQRNGQQDPDQMSILMEVSLLQLVVRYGSFEHPLDELDIFTE